MNKIFFGKLLLVLIGFVLLFGCNSNEPTPRSDNQNGGDTETELTSLATDIVRTETPEDNDGKTPESSSATVTISDPTPIPAPTLFPTPSMQSILDDSMLVSQAGGISEALAVEDTLVFMGEGRRVIVIDISDIENPRIFSKSNPLNHSVAKIVVSGQYAFVGGYGEEGLSVLNISDLENITFVTHVDGSANQVERWGDYLISISGDIHWFDISDPEEPTTLPSYIIPGATSGYAIVESIAYVLTLNDGLVIVDISNPIEPVMLSQESTLIRGREIDVSGNYAYATVREDGSYQDVLYIIDISEPSHPIIVGKQAITFSTAQTDLFNTIDLFIDDSDQMYISGDYPFNTSGAKVLRYDLSSNPTAPIRLPDYSSTDHIHDLIKVSDHLLGVSFGGGLEIFDTMAQDANGNHVNLFFQWPAIEFNVYQDYIFVSSGETGGLIAIDWHNKENLNLIDHYFSERKITAMETGNDILFLFSLNVMQPAETSPRRVELLRISSLPILETVGFIDLPEWAIVRQMYVKENNLYLLLDQGGIYLYDISSPESPQFISSFIGLPKEFVVIDQIAFILEESYGSQPASFKIVDFSDPGIPVELSQYILDETAGSLNIQDEVALFTVSNDPATANIHMLDVSDLTAPTKIGESRLSDSAYSMVIADGLAYVRTDDPGFDRTIRLEIFDISDPLRPLPVASTNFGVSQVTVTHNGYLIMSDFRRGLQLFYWPFQNNDN